MTAKAVTEEKRMLGKLAKKLYLACAVAGFVFLGISTLLICFCMEEGHTFFSAYLVNFCFFLSLSLGALFFVILQHLTKAGWSVVVRRIAEVIAGNLPLLALLFIPLLFGLSVLYPWADAAHASGDHLLEIKRPFLNLSFFLIRAVIYFLIWWICVRYFLRTSLKQDESGDPELTSQMQARSPVAMILFALTTTFAAFDWLMSLTPHWYSTIYGVYFFAGAALGFFALITVVIFTLQKGGYVTRSITIEHYHDLGKLIFAFVVFWAYIAFSQYMLIWYANIPEETVWYLERQTGQWTYVSLLLLFGHFLIPFVLLLSRYPKRNKMLLFIAAKWILLMHWCDLYWLIMPQFSPGKIGFHWLHVTTYLGFAGLFIAAILYRLRNISLVPEKDPRLEESQAFENA